MTDSVSAEHVCTRKCLRWMTDHGTRFYYCNLAQPVKVGVQATAKRATKMEQIDINDSESAALDSAFKTLRRLAQVTNTEVSTFVRTDGRVTIHGSREGFVRWTIHADTDQPSADPKPSRGIKESEALREDMRRAKP